ncbi:restriction endonuclease subunit S [Brenneria tiliae]|uniref:restriction endonuclease subunit S n=1 Tax=Brenneria tiliae TaxID=2914984 RepID=UPI002014A317|nr:restriction endonuclease subunit S [Brenneria tiliae]MCL2899121.1 restriction endonuclease subunit S [Brenneria tiliae]MCL2903499.1 restriction endonuclease subunit S [Brenneria tiliae]
MNKHTAELLEKHFDTAFAAPDGIKKLRELILTLAMQGRLVPQDPSDQPASELLKEIEAEKQRMVKEGKIRKPKPLPPVTEGEKPYALPQGWEWVRLGNIGLINPRNNADDAMLAGFVPMPLIQEGYSEFHSFYERPWSKIKKGYTHFTNGDVGMAKITPCFENAKSCVFSNLPNGIGAGTTELHIFRNAFHAVDPRYLLFFLKNPKFISKMAARMTGSAGQKRVPTPLFTKLELPLPPKSEQHRIVAKIDELMARCDELEKLRVAQQEKRLTVHAAAIRQLLNITEPDQHRHARAFLAKHFGELYTVKENVAELRKAILQLGVMGKLVPQNPNDQPASELLKEIEVEKQRLVETGKIKKPKRLQSVTEEEKPYVLPQGWEWSRLGYLALSSDSGWSPQCLPEMRKDQEWGVLKVSAVSWGKFNPHENKALPASLAPRMECEVKCGDFLISRANTDELVARSVVVEETPPHLMMSDKIVRFRLSNSVNKAFVNMVNGVPYSRTYYMGNASGTSSSMKNVSRETISLLPVPLPPIAEQNRIVAKINELMALCDELDQQIDTTVSKQDKLLNALMHAQLQSNTEEKNQPELLSKDQVIDLTTYRTSIGCYAINKLANAQYFGRTAAAKVMYLAQAHIGLELDLKPEREAAGPLDIWIYDFERQGQNKGWFVVNEKTLASGRKKTEYRCLSALTEPSAKAEKLMSSEQKAEFDRLIYALADKKTEEVEIIATLFAVWNDFLIDSVQPTDEQIITDMRENWHERKARFSPSDLKPWLSWLRKEGFIPRGLPPRTTQLQRLGV